MKIKFPMCVAMLGLMAAFSNASATALTDTYHGGDAHGYGDVIAGAGVHIYDVHGMDASRSGSVLTVTIYTNFAGNAGTESQWTRNGTGIGYGDLFLSSDWNPHGSGVYATDNAANGNHWTYAFTLDDAFSTTGGVGTIYALGAGSAGNHNPDALLSDHFMNCAGRCVYRNGQEVAVDTSRAVATNTTGTWTVGNGFLSFSFDTSDLDLNPNSFGFHWTMYCGNDVIEGLDPVTVPEPETADVFLLGLGLISLVMLRQRKAAAKLAS
ncbi:PEP-CTERM sorting domain-containing protein [Rhodanobacter caeni]|uniref:Ice-binding protein C-terminal domain-containing protein n=1 Tax=Rhodanobacter caeni TaxID=657654 RepID=A0ABN0U9B9_9GAMM